MKISEQVQEQLEQLWIAEMENGASLLQAPAQDSPYQEIISLGLAEQDGQLLHLTSAGKKEAARAIRRHRLAERLVVDVLVADEEVVDEQACNLEHALMDGIEESICTLLGHPRICPHGKPIPSGRCCEQQRLTVGPLIAAMNDLKAGQEGHISYLHMHNPQHLQKLMAMGVLPGAAVRIKAVYPSIVFEAGYSQFAVDEETAREIYVRLENPNPEIYIDRRK